MERFTDLVEQLLPILPILMPCPTPPDSSTAFVTISGRLSWLPVHKTWILRVPLPCCRKRRLIQGRTRSTSARRDRSSLGTRRSRARYLYLHRPGYLLAIRNLLGGLATTSASRPELRRSDDKLATLRSYRKARGLCVRCGEKWAPGHRYAPVPQVHALQEVWAVC